MRVRSSIGIATRLAAVLTVAAVTLGVQSSTTRASTTPFVIYADSLASGWSNWSWNATINWQDTTDPHSGSYDAAFTFDNAWDGLSTGTNSPIDTTPYDLLQFWINGDSSGGQALTVILENGGSGLSDPVDVSPYVEGGSIKADTWELVQIPLSVLGASDTQLDQISFFNNTASTQPEMLLDDLSLINDGKTPPPPSTVNVDVALNAKAGVHAISPYIYGVAFAGETYLKANNLTLERWGGNAVTRYNWRLGAASNTASDWYFENTDGGNSCTAPGCAVDQMVAGDRAASAASLITVPTIGWVAKNSDLNTCGFEVSKYGPQQQTDPYRPNCGNGIKPNGQPITGNDPTDIQAWIKHLVAKFGAASHGGVKFFAMDNEPELWNSTHRDVHPQPLTYDGLYNEFETYASAIKKVDPSAMIDGPIPWGWPAYFDSSYDYANNTESDRLAHGNMAIIPWFLKTVRAHDKKTHVRTLNVLDVHFYPQESNVFGNDNGPATDALRLQATRSLWDPTYTDPSWINAKIDLIPRMKAWIARYYPGTKFGISEWNFGDENAMNGALAIADVLGIYGQQDVYLASYWTHPDQATLATRAFDMYRNYDGHDGAFGNESVQTTSRSPSDLMAFGAVRTNDQKLTVMLVNQNPDAEDITKLSLKNFSPGSEAQIYQLGTTTPSIQQLPDIAASSSITLTVPPNSIDLLVIPKK